VRAPDAGNADGCADLVAPGALVFWGNGGFQAAGTQPDDGIDEAGAGKGAQTLDLHGRGTGKRGFAAIRQRQSQKTVAVAGFQVVAFMNDFARARPLAVDTGLAPDMRNGCRGGFFGNQREGDADDAANRHPGGFSDIIEVLQSTPVAIVVGVALGQMDKGIVPDNPVDEVIAQGTRGLGMDGKTGNEQRQYGQQCSS